MDGVCFACRSSSLVLVLERSEEWAVFFSNVVLKIQRRACSNIMSCLDSSECRFIILSHLALTCVWFVDLTTWSLLKCKKKRQVHLNSRNSSSCNWKSLIESLEFWANTAVASGSVKPTSLHCEGHCFRAWCFHCIREFHFLVGDQIWSPF